MCSQSDDPSMHETVSVYDPDGYERVLAVAEAEAMGDRDEAYYCNPQIEGEADHWHRRNLWSDAPESTPID